MNEHDILLDEDMEPNPELNKITNAILGAAIEVHRALGPGFPESVYCKALEVEFKARGINYRPQCPIDVYYKGVLVGQGKMDFLVEEKVVMEVKAVENFAPIHTAQAISYLRATHHALLTNFNVRKLKDGIKRVAA